MKRFLLALLAAAIAAVTVNAGSFTAGDGTFTLKATGDTFIDTTRWGKGQIYINGHAIGRYWNIGPQQSLYVPGCWLRRGTNDIIVLDLLDTPTRHSKP